LIGQVAKVAKLVNYLKIYKLGILFTSLLIHHFTIIRGSWFNRSPFRGGSRKSI